ncbi:DUF4344 domain-containing metallopeptidase [Methylobacterium brachythecii]|uniref:Metallopeptidase n=1 Tax=Methylobacterium brachythecii TaxID=1176177 RepID=A0A7W6AKH3_9HYPH|nr:DUF4344 domain-containing metallopeptidase [Methylobacterium brachythecii]MBB3902834.1 hypothetical protein [Methylobacterium brachythecii]GLS43760.1 hypothetical protein GCM10007884_17450 [Methylobacterium brachythecii]
MRGYDLLAALLAASLTTSTSVAGAIPSRARIHVVYTPPKSPPFRSIYDAMRQHRVLERVGTIVSLVRLPTRLTYRLKECTGELNAWYAPESQSVTICYELIDSIVKSAPQTKSPAGVTRQDAIRGPIFQILLHESGHALFDLLQVPILGREEDAADQVASLILLHLGPADTRMVVKGGGYYFATVAKDEPADKGAFADVHGFSWQRFYNLACLAYGSDRKRYRTIVNNGYLPKERAEGCEEEYQQVAFAFRKLIGPHLRMRPNGGARLRRALCSAFRS